MTNKTTPCDRPMTRPPVPVLHNMSSRPSATISHEGRHQCNLVCISLRAFADPSAEIVETWCRLIGLPFKNDAQGIEQIRGVVAAPPPAYFQLPAIAPVVPPVRAAIWAGLSENPRLALSVLCRCSDKVFIRGKSPLVTLANLRRDVGLVLPLTTKESGS